MYNNPNTFRFWCQKVLPLVYDDSLSYYELLCKVVDYLNKIIEDNKKEIAEIEKIKIELVNLKNYIDNFVANNLEKEVIKVLNEWADSGKFDDLINRIIVHSVKHNSNKYCVYVNTEKVVETKITDTAQGFCCNGDYFYMLHHVSDADPMYLLTLTKDGNVVNDEPLNQGCGIKVSGVHGNSLCWYNGYLYSACAGDGSNTHKQTEIMKIDPETYATTFITQNYKISALSFFTDLNGKDYFGCIPSGTQAFQTGRITDGYVCMYNRYINMMTVPNLKQGLLSTKSHHYIPYSGYGSFHYNMIRVYSHGLHNTIDVMLLDFNDKEMEDLGRFEDEEVMYWNDSSGNIYKFDTTGLFTESGDGSSFNSVSQRLPNYVLTLNNNTKNILFNTHLSSGVEICTGFSLPYDFYRTWTVDCNGYFSVLTRHVVPVMFRPDTGDLSVDCVIYTYITDKYYPVNLRFIYYFNNSDNTFKLGLFSLICTEKNFAYINNNVTESNYDVVCSKIHELLPSVTQLFDSAYIVFYTGQNPGGVIPWKC